MIKQGTKTQKKQQSTVHKHMEVVMDPEVATTATEEIKEAITTNTEVDIKVTKTTENLSIWITEEIISGTTMGTQLMHQKWLIELLLFILQVWKVTEVIEAEGLQEEEEDPIEDTDQDEVQAEDLIKDINQNQEMVKVSAEDMDQVGEQIGENKEDMTKDKDPIEEQEEDRTEALDLAEEEKKEHNMIPDTKLKIDIAWCAKSEDTVHYFTAPSYQNIFPEVIMSNPFPKNYVKHASQLLVTSRIVLITSQRTTITGYASRAR